MPPEEPGRHVGGSDPARALVDAHVHFHDGFDEARFYEGAAANLAAAAARLLAPGTRWTGMLVLTESAGANHFDRLRARVGGRIGDRLAIEDTGEPCSVRVGDAAVRAPLVVIGGRQVQTREGLEVLVFPVGDAFPDGRPIRSVLARAVELRACATIPWGFGKWSLRRGRLLDALLRERAGPGPGFMLGDTAHRPGWAPTPGALRLAERSGEATPVGSDPLPLRDEDARPGSCCFEVAVDGSAAEPARALVRALATARGPLRRYERRPGLLRFATTQLAMQALKRRRRR